MLRSWVNKPLLSLDAINTRLDLVEFFFNNGVLRQDLNAILTKLHDLERLVNRVNSGTARPPDLVALREDFQALPHIIALLKDKHPVLDEILEKVSPFDQERERLEAAIEDEPPATLANIGIIRPGFSEALDKTLYASKHAREWINNLESHERQRTGIKNLRVGYNKVFGYYIEVSRGQTDQAPDDYIRKQTLVNSERYITPELKEYESLVLNAEAQIHDVELKVWKDLCDEISSVSTQILKTAQAIAH